MKATESFFRQGSGKQAGCPTQRAPDGWESPRFQAVCMARSWFRQSGAASSRPPAGNAHRWATFLKIMNRKKDPGICETCHQAFGYHLIHNGFNDSSYAYCDRCGKTCLLDHWHKSIPKGIKLKYEVVDNRVARLLKQCECGGTFKKGASPRFVVHIAIRLCLPLKPLNTLSRMLQGAKTDGDGKRIGKVYTASSSRIRLWKIIGKKRPRRYRKFIVLAGQSFGNCQSLSGVQ